MNKDKDNSNGDDKDKSSSPISQDWLHNVAFIQHTTSKQQQQTEELLCSIKFLKDNMEALTKSYAVQAEMRKRMYDAHINAGFNSQQALELLKI